MNDLARPAPRVLEAALSGLWAIHEPALHQILAIIEREGENPQALATRLGRPLDNARETRVRDGGVAVIGMRGPIFRYANLFTDISGGLTLDALARDLRLAVEAPAVTSIVLEIDSPGGESNGIGEMAAQIRAASAIKPVVAYVDGVGASAAYWLASAASEVVVSGTAMLGSIGVISTWRDTSERDAKSGVKRVEFVSSQSPDKRPDIATPAGRATVQAVVDRLAVEFIGAVARFRRVAPEKVASDFGRGSLLVGSDAVKAGMADRRGSFEALITELARGRAAASPAAPRGETKVTLRYDNPQAATPAEPIGPDTVEKDIRRRCVLAWNAEPNLRAEFRSIDRLVFYEIGLLGQSFGSRNEKSTIERYV